MPDGRQLDDHSASAGQCVQSPLQAGRVLGGRQTAHVLLQPLELLGNEGEFVGGGHGKNVGDIVSGERLTGRQIAGFSSCTRPVTRRPSAAMRPMIPTDRLDRRCASPRTNCKERSSRAQVLASFHAMQPTASALFNELLKKDIELIEAAR